MQVKPDVQTTTFPNKQVKQHSESAKVNAQKKLQETLQDVRKDNEEVEVSPEKMQEITNKLNGFLIPKHTNLNFVFHRELQEYYMTIENSDTHEVVKTIPPKRMLDTYAAMLEFVGILVDDTV